MSDVKNYRLITVSNVFSNILASIILSRLNKFLEEKGLRDRA